MERTAATVADLVAYGIAHADSFANAVGNEWGEITSFVPEFAVFPVSRYLTMQKYISGRASSDLQIVELGAGFTPLSHSLADRVSQWVEVDLPNNSALKQKISNDLNSPKNITYLAGDALTQDVWNYVNLTLDANKPTIIFSCGLISQYFNSSQKDLLASYAKSQLVKQGSVLLIEDTLQNHPELENETIINAGCEKIRKTSGNDLYGRIFHPWMNEKLAWHQRGFFVAAIPYVIPQMQGNYLVNNFKFITCTTGGTQ